MGVDRNIGNNGASSVVFEVYVDGLKKYESGVMNYNTPSKKVSVNVTRAEEVKLVMTDAGNGNGSDHGDWANAKFLVLAPPAAEVVALQATLDFTTPITGLSYVNPSLTHQETRLDNLMKVKEEAKNLLANPEASLDELKNMTSLLIYMIEELGQTYVSGGQAVPFE